MVIKFHRSTVYSGDHIEGKSDPLRSGRAWWAIALGVIGITITFFAFREALSIKSLLDHGVKVDGVVVEVLNRTTTKKNNTTTHYTSRVSYYDSNATEYSAYRSGQSSLGSKLAVIYDPENPSSHMFAENSQNPLLPMMIFTGIGVVMAFVGILILAFWLKARAHVQQLLRSGKKVIAKVKEVRVQETARLRRRRGQGQPGFTITIGNSTPNYAYTYTSQIVAEYEDQLRGGSQVFLSPAISGQLSDVFVGKEIPVYVNPKDPSDYYMGMPCLRAAGIR